MEKRGAEHPTLECQWMLVQPHMALARGSDAVGLCPIPVLQRRVRTGCLSPHLCWWLHPGLRVMEPPQFWDGRFYFGVVPKWPVFEKSTSQFPLSSSCPEIKGNLYEPPLPLHTRNISFFYIWAFQLEFPCSLSHECALLI